MASEHGSLRTDLPMIAKPVFIYGGVEFTVPSWEGCDIVRIRQRMPRAQIPVATKDETTNNKNEWFLLGSFWLLVGIPILWGLWKTLNQSMFIFKT